MRSGSGVVFLLVVGLCVAAVSSMNVPVKKPVARPPSTFDPRFFEGVKKAYAPYLRGASEREKARFAHALLQNTEKRLKDKAENPQAYRPLVYFNCSTYGPSPVPPTNVNQLRPGDIGIVAALGDSITAGFGAGASSIFSVFTEYRGLSWSIGGDDSVSSVLTVPNALRQYNPAVKGFSFGTGKEDSSNSQLDIAVSGAVASDMPGQAQALIDKIKANSTYDFENSWKLVTLFIGGNDLCKYCRDTEGYSPQNYFNNIQSALDILQAGLPKTLVNLVPVVDVTRLASVSSGLCFLLHPFECPCGTGSDSEQQQVREAQAAYVQQTQNLAALEKYQNDDDFAVVIQPFLVDTQVPLNSDGQPDGSYFAPDCFHFSEKAHAAAAVGLWNNMFEPVSEKKTAWVVDEPFECPPPDSYIITNANTPK